MNMEKNIVTSMFDKQEHKSISVYIEIIKEAYEHKSSHKWCEMNVD